MKMLTICFVVAVLFLSACSTSSNNNQSAAAPYVEPTPYQKTELGMSYTEFETLCGRPSPPDRYLESTETTGKIVMVITQARSETKCWGTFSFKNGKLENWDP